MLLTKNDQILVKQVSDNLKRGRTSSFLDKRELSLVISYLNKNKSSYQIYYLFNDCDKVIIYDKELPKITLFKIISKINLTNSDILGTLFSLNIDRHIFGDIIEIDKIFYFPVLDNIASYIKNNLTIIKKSMITLEEESLSLIENYERNYDTLEYIVSSPRIDIIVSRITNLSRKNILELFNKNEILLNYNYSNNYAYLLKEGDVFSIRKHGKYRYKGIIRETKSKKKVIKLEKYK